MNQQTLTREYTFEGRGLHTGKYAHLTIQPAPANFGIRFVRTDVGVEIPAVASAITRTDRSTTVSSGEVNVVTIEHLMSALTGLGVDNARIEIDNEEVPILDGSAERYVRAIAPDGLQVQDAERVWLEFAEPFEVADERTGSWVRVEPAEEMSFEVTVDFGSRVLGVQKARWSENTDYVGQIAPCRTFVFMHELEFLAARGLVKGGDVDNAIVIVEHPVTPEQIDNMCVLFGMPHLSVTEAGYLSNIKLHFPDECGRHKLLDLIGDMRLAGGFPKARITAYKPGHTINSLASRAALAKIKKA
ncbi:UDP-3-0-acyl N-acetylglucosamine deacetylase [Bacteroidales bacterium WCE2004]|nr:UDP-3-O-acyl-N-acetylglucosamine deacetylase [Bacteroidales bacterium]MCR5352140.1 UDP-3-O-acyl-N-acetylglucosamine deacetylase [Bacteroidales bacterium]SKC54799.1 UDP-3-0-acyl N-acetylglucosamine deacetylase [Bacteroidales bacterium WCE2004]